MQMSKSPIISGYDHVVKFVSDLRQVGGFVRVLRLTEHHDMAEILLNVAWNTTTLAFVIFVNRLT